MENARVERSVVTALCLALGHEPELISSISIYPDRVTVTYDHFITPHRLGSDDADTLARPRDW